MKKFLTIIGILFFTANILFFKTSFAYSAQLESNPEQVTSEISNSINKLMQDMFRGLSDGKNININTSIPMSPIKEVSFDDIINVKSLSGDDILEAIKEVLILAINLFLMVINIVAEVLRGLLGVLNSGK